MLSAYRAIFRQSSNLMISLVLDNLISSAGEVDQPQPVWKLFVVDDKFSNCCAKNIFFAHLGGKGAKHINLNL